MPAATLDTAIDALRKLSPERQQELVAFILHIAADDEAAQTIDPADLPFVLEGLAQARRGEFASADDVDAAYRSFDE